MWTQAEGSGTNGSPSPVIPAVEERKKMLEKLDDLEIIVIPDTIDKYGEDLFKAIKDAGFVKVQDDR